MNRTIKFRGKSLYNNEWVYGYLLERSGKTEIYNVNPDGSLFWANVYPQTAGQFTGLHDVNGKEIYEGDVIAGKYEHLHVIRYNGKEATYTATLLNKYFQTYFEIECAVTQRWIDETGKHVFGNIHDNPELLKGGRQ